MATILKVALLSLCLFGTKAFSAEPTDQEKALAKIKMSAAVREKFVNAFGYSFGSDEMSRVKRTVVDAGYASLTAHLRFAVADAKSSFVFSPALKSTLSDVEVLVSRMNMSGHGIVLKPILVADSDGMNVSTRLTEIEPKNPALFFNTYYTEIRRYAEIARNRNVSELVVGVGLNKLWNSKNSAEWIDILKSLRKKMDQKNTLLSFELSSDLDIQAFEAWSKENPISYEEMLSNLNKVRLSVSPLEGSLGGGDWSANLTANRINELITKAKELFPGKTYSLANVTIPGCRTRNMHEDEVECVNDPDIQDGFYDYAYQFSGYEAWNQAIQSLSVETLSSIQEIEFMFSVTEFDPGEEKSDPRFIFFNQKIKEILLKKTK